MSSRIQIIAGPDAGSIFPVPPGTKLSIGRGSDSDTQLNDPTVSRLHCEISNDGKRRVLTSRSDKGTLVNGFKVTEQDLRHGDVVRIGATAFRFIIDSLEQSDTAYQSAPK